MVVETIARIRRERFVKGKSIKEIVRELKVSRNTVRKVLRSGATSFEYLRTVQPRPKLGSWRADLDRMLSGNEAKPARERLTLIRIFEGLRAFGYEGSYDAVRRYAKRWRAEHGAAMAEAFVETYQVKYERAADCLTNDRDALLAFYDFPAEHWKHLRTTNPIESTFATVRHRTIRSKGCLSNKTALAIVFKLVEGAQKNGRRIDGHNQLPKLIQGVRFTDAIEVIGNSAAPQAQAAA